MVAQTSPEDDRMGGSMPSKPLLACVAALGAGWTSAAAARPLEAEFPKTGDSCWERVYDDAHLAAHPKQRVTRVQLHHLGSRWSDGGADGFYLLLGVNLRKRLGPPDDDIDFKLGGMCLAKGAGLICRNGWDAGVFRVDRSGDGLVVTNGGGIIANPSSYDSEDVADNAVKVPAKPDDRSWRLERAPQSRCKL